MPAAGRGCAWHQVQWQQKVATDLPGEVVMKEAGAMGNQPAMAMDMDMDMDTMDHPQATMGYQSDHCYMCSRSSHRTLPSFQRAIGECL